MAVAKKRNHSVRSTHEGYVVFLYSYSIRFFEFAKCLILRRYLLISNWLNIGFILAIKWSIIVNRRGVQCQQPVRPFFRM